jgi:hypothetical protein
MCLVMLAVIVAQKKKSIPLLSKEEIREEFYK